MAQFSILPNGRTNGKRIIIIILLPFVRPLGRIEKDLIRGPSLIDAPVGLLHSDVDSASLLMP